MREQKANKIVTVISLSILIVLFLSSIALIQVLINHQEGRSLTYNLQYLVLRFAFSWLIVFGVIDVINRVFNWVERKWGQNE